MSVLNVAPAGVRVTVRVNVAPRRHEHCRDGVAPPRVELSVEAAAEMPVGAGAAVAPAGIVAAIAAPISTAQANTIRNKWVRDDRSRSGHDDTLPAKAVCVRSFARRSSAVKGRTHM